MENPDSGNLPGGNVANESSREYVEWLSMIDTTGGVLRFLARSRDFPVKTSEGGGCDQRSPQAILQATMASRRVQEAIRDETLAREWPREAVETEAQQMLDVMGHNFHLNSVRFVGFPVLSVVKRIFDAIYVNLAGLRRVRECVSEDSVVFMPTHRTYMDFLLVSLLCFDVEMPLPAIAAGMDFMQSRFMGEALRRCGAFFIRRSFGQDRLYWAVFTEYVQQHLRGADRPVEFFLEGTRSRTGKSLHPKFGLLQVLLEPYLRSQLYDLTIVPVTINYDKVLEESLYAYELLGFPKPKESTSGLFKARQILDRRFGTIYMTFGEPISVRRYFGTMLHRFRHALEPDAFFCMSESEKDAIREFGHRVIGIHNGYSRVNIWPLAATVILQILESRREKRDPPVIPYAELLGSLQRFVELTRRLQGNLVVKTSVEEDLKYHLSLHSDLFVDGKIDGDFLLLAHFPVDRNGGRIARETIAQAVPRIILANKANEAMHMFADESLVATALLHVDSSSFDDLLPHFCWLQCLFNWEFICVPGEERESLRRALRRLTAAGIIGFHHENDRIQLLRPDDLHFIAALIKRFLAAYAVMAHVLHTHRGGGDSWTETNAVVDAQRAIAWSLDEHGTRKTYQRDEIQLPYAALSSDALKNAFHSFANVGALRKLGRNGDDGTARFALNETVHWQLMSNLEKFGAPRLREWDSRPAVKSKL